MRIGEHDIGVCSWSLAPKNMSDLVAMMRRLELSHTQLGLGGLVAMNERSRASEIKTLTDAGIQLTAGMIGFPGEDYSTIASIKQTGGYVPDEHWEVRREMTTRAAELSKSVGLKMLSTHIGFVPPSSDEKYKVMLDRVCKIAEILMKQNLNLLMETGQEAASELLQFLNDVRCRNVFVNFDPANMILYGAGDQIEALQTLGRLIRHIHVKDAIASDQAGMAWGKEVPFGTGQVPVDDFLAALHSADYKGPLVIEREAGDTRLEDVEFAIDTIRRSIEGP
jgi:L-ribulose-5-phosphate 3-epimerase